MTLYPPQEDAIQTALIDKTRRFILNWEMGTGKSVGAAEIISVLNLRKTLIVCPALVRLDWCKTIEKFCRLDVTWAAWRFGNRKNLTKAQKEELIDAAAAEIQIVSPDLIEQARAGDWEAIILDEIHMYKNEKAERSKMVRRFVENNPEALILGLTGTLAPNDLGDIWNPLDILWPKRFGAKWSFRARYQNQRQKIINEETGEQRAEFYGVNEDNAPELAKRLAAVSTRITRKDLAKYLPPFDIKLLRFDVDCSWKLLSNKAPYVEEALEQAAISKHDHVVNWVVDTAENTPHVACLAHHKNIAWALAQDIATKLPLRKVVYVDGEIPVDKRIAKIEEAKAANQAILVGTIQSMGIGISLTKFTQAIFTEFHWSPGVMEQVLLRFSRLDSMVPSAVYFSLVPGTIDEVIATRLEEKFRAINSIADTGQVGGKMTSLLQLDEAEFLKGITEAVLSEET